MLPPADSPTSSSASVFVLRLRSPHPPAPAFVFRLQLRPRIPLHLWPREARCWVADSICAHRFHPRQRTPLHVATLLLCHGPPLESRGIISCAAFVYARPPPPSMCVIPLLHWREGLYCRRHPCVSPAVCRCHVSWKPCQRGRSPPTPSFMRPPLLVVRPLRLDGAVSWLVSLSGRNEFRMACFGFLVHGCPLLSVKLLYIAIQYIRQCYYCQYCIWWSELSWVSF